VNDYHQNHIIEMFDKNSLYNTSKNGIKNRSKNIDNISKISKIESKRSYDSQDELNLKSIDPIYDDDKNSLKSGNIHKIIESNNYNQTKYNIENSRELKKSYENKNGEATEICDLKYCGEKNLNCKCCPDKICRKGNCLCCNCMEKNIKIKGLKKGILINKKGLIAKKKNGKYFCCISFLKESKSENGRKIIGKVKCMYNIICKECEELNDNSNEYENFIKYD